MRFNTLQHIDNEVQIKLRKQDQDTFLEMLNSEVFNCKDITNFTKAEIYAFAVKFYAPYSSSILFRLGSSLSTNA